MFTNNAFMTPAVSVLERLVRHHVAPVTGRVADAQQDRLLFEASAFEGLGPPLLPLDRIVRVLSQVRTGRFAQAVGHDRNIGQRSEVRGPRSRTTRLRDVWRDGILLRMNAHWSPLAFLSVAIGGAAGSVARYIVGSVVQRTGTGFPYGTLAVNVTGSFMLGLLMRFLVARAAAPELRLALTIGLCGGYTTFSTFAYETTLLLPDGRLARATTYAVASVFLTVGAMATGFAAGRLALAIPR